MSRRQPKTSNLYFFRIELILNFVRCVGSQCRVEHKGAEGSASQSVCHDCVGRTCFNCKKMHLFKNKINLPQFESIRCHQNTDGMDLTNH